jgi:hypothetical protein
LTVYEGEKMIRKESFPELEVLIKSFAVGALLGQTVRVGVLEIADSRNCICVSGVCYEEDI